MPSRPRLLSAIALALLCSAPVAAFQPHILLDVRASGSATSFEVFESRGVGPTHFWCVAADHARRVLGAASNQRIYVARPLGASQIEPGRKAVGFTLSAAEVEAEKPKPSPLTLLTYTTIRSAGASMNLTQALQYCTDHMSVP